MRNINTIIVTSLLIILTFSGYHAFIKDQLEVKKQKRLLTNSQKTISSPKTNITQTDVEKSYTKNESSIKRHNYKESNYKFSSDPVIHESIVGRKYHVCQQYFYTKIFLVKDYEKQFNSEVQRDYYMDSISNCEKLNNKHPEYGLSNTRKQVLERIKRKATSKFGKLLEYNKEPYTHEESLFVYKTLGRDYPDLINSPSIYKTMQYEIDVVEPDLQYILQTTSKNYIFKIINLAQNYLACDLGANCGNDSSMMFFYCRFEPNFCVEDFMVLFNTRLTAGVRSDVLLALPYIENLFQVD